MHFLYDQISALSADDSVAKLEIGAQISVIGKLLKLMMKVNLLKKKS